MSASTALAGVDAGTISCPCLGVRAQRLGAADGLRRAVNVVKWPSPVRFTIVPPKRA
jgi:hypothetical protein